MKLKISLLLAASTALITTSGIAATIAGTGFSDDLIIEAAAADSDAGISNNSIFNDFGIVQDGFTNSGANPSPSGFVLPTSGTVTSDQGTVFQLQSATANNLLKNSDTFTLTTPGQYEDLQFLVFGISGAFQATINFSDTTTAAVDASLGDWFGGGGSGNNAGTSVVNFNSSKVAMHRTNGPDTKHAREVSFDLDLADQAKTISSISFSGTGNSLGVVAISGTPVPEPSAFGLLAGCFGLAWVMLRRRA